MLDFETSIWGLEITFVESYFFLENYVTTEGAVSHNVLYYQQLSIACYTKLVFMPIIILSICQLVSTAFCIAYLLMYFMTYHVS